MGRIDWTCPACGSGTGMDVWMGLRYWAECTDCGAKGPSVPHDGERDRAAVESAVERMRVAYRPRQMAIELEG